MFSEGVEDFLRGFVPAEHVAPVPDPVAAIREYLTADNKDPEPDVWTGTVESILAKVRASEGHPQTVTRFAGQTTR